MNQQVTLPRSRFWTMPEVAVLRRDYERLGPEKVRELLPHRTYMAITGKAAVLGIAAPAQTFSRKRWPADASIDAQIRLVYQSTPARGAINALAARLMRPRWWVSKRALTLGFTSPRFKEPAWAEDEIELLASHADKPLTTIQRVLARNGYRRTLTAIVVKRKRIGIGSRDPNYYTAHHLARLLGVDPGTVTDWIKREGLTANHRGTKRLPQQGGDMWWISRRKLRSWIGAHAQLVDLRKVERFWFIDLMMGKYE